MMDILTREDLKVLMAREPGVSVSLFMPAEREGFGDRNLIRFKNLLRRAETGLKEKGMSGARVQEFVGPAQRFLQDTMFWRYQSDGLAVFLAEGVFQYYRLPVRFDELVIVNDRFAIKPLMPLFTTEGRYLVLCLNQKHTRLLMGDHHALSEIDLKTLPRKMQEALKYDEFEEYILSHTSTSQNVHPQHPHGGQLTFHSHGDVGGSDPKDERLRYFRIIDHNLHALLMTERIPLVLSGVEYLLPIYREANTYQQLMPEMITGNPDLIGTDEMRRRAWDIVRPYYERSRRAALDTYLEFLGAGNRRAVDSADAVVTAADQGRVDTLFVAAGQERWGRFDPSTQTVQEHELAQAGDEGLLDLAISRTLANDGKVYALSQDEMPRRAAVAALLRY